MNGLLLVSHSLELASGLRALLRELAGSELAVSVAGGEDPLGVSSEMVVTAIEEMQARGVERVAVIGDLGSAFLASEAAIETNSWQDQVIVVDCPMVEGAVAASMTLSIGGTLDEAIEAAEKAWEVRKA